MQSNGHKLDDTQILIFLQGICTYSGDKDGFIHNSLLGFTNAQYVNSLPLGDLSKNLDK